MNTSPLPMLGACAHRQLEFDVKGTLLDGSNVIVASMQARCARCGKMMTMLGAYSASPSDRQVSITENRQMILVPMVGDHETPRFPKPIILTDETNGPQTA